jgi:hypothetical protein
MRDSRGIQTFQRHLANEFSSVYVFALDAALFWKEQQARKRYALLAWRSAKKIDGLLGAARPNFGCRVSVLSEVLP